MRRSWAREGLERFHGYDVVDFKAGDPLPDPTRTAVRVKIGLDSPSELLSDRWAEFMNSDGVEKIEALVIGNWVYPDGDDPSSEDAVVLLVSSAERFPNLRALFFGDITPDEIKMTWIHQSDVSPFWGAFPHLREFGIRGGWDLELGTIRHAKLKTLKVEAAGVMPAVVHEIGAADLPELEHLEIWLGQSASGGHCRPHDLAGILDGQRFPKLATLALRDCEWADDLAVAVATAPILYRVKRLDISLGTLGDVGVDALVASPAVRRLQHINIAHHYVSDAGVAKLNALGIDVDASDRQEIDRYRGEEYRYVAVRE
jgi:hypothetical protein